MPSRHLAFRLAFPASLFLATGACALGQNMAAQPATADKTAEPNDERPYKLMVGDKAPQLAISKWLKGEPFTGFEKGRVYVVEFWASWCGPCKAGMPHVSELQKKYEDNGLTVLGVNIWEDPSNLEEWMKTAGDNLMHYTVAVEEKIPDTNPRQTGKMAEDWMRAAGRNGIPSAFIVNQDGKIAWIGHPMRMDDALGKVVKGEYDLAAAAADYVKTVAEEARVARLQEQARPALVKLGAAMRAEDWDAALDALKDVMAIDPSLAAQHAPLKFNILFVNAKDYDAAYAAARELSQGPIKDNAQALNSIAWTILDTADVPNRDVGLALQLATRAVELTNNNDGMILDTLAYAHYQKGDAAKALRIQEKACELVKDNPQMLEEMNARLDMYRKAVNG